MKVVDCTLGLTFRSYSDLFSVTECGFFCLRKNSTLLNSNNNYNKNNNCNAKWGILSELMRCQHILMQKKACPKKYIFSTSKSFAFHNFELLVGF